MLRMSAVEGNGLTRGRDSLQPIQQRAAATTTIIRRTVNCTRGSLMDGPHGGEVSTVPINEPMRGQSLPKMTAPNGLGDRTPLHRSISSVIHEGSCRIG